VLTRHTWSPLVRIIMLDCGSCTVSRSLDSITAIIVGLFAWLLMTTLKHVKFSILEKGSSYSNSRIAILREFRRSRNRPKLCVCLSYLLSGTFYNIMDSGVIFMPKLSGNWGLLTSLLSLSMDHTCKLLTDGGSIATPWVLNIICSNIPSTFGEVMTIWYPMRHNMP